VNPVAMHMRVSFNAFGDALDAWLSSIASAPMFCFFKQWLPALPGQPSATRLGS
jgi:hypothetical protein